MQLPANAGLFRAFITIVQVSTTIGSKGLGGWSPVEARCIDSFGEEPAMPP
jgi:hypothetical protein